MPGGWLSDAACQGPTRGSACLDLIISKDPDLVKDVEVIGQFVNSDHRLIKFKIVASQPEAINKRQLINHSRADFTKIRNEVGVLQWNLQGDAEEAWEDSEVNCWTSKID